MKMIRGLLLDVLRRLNRCDKGGNRMNVVEFVTEGRTKNSLLLRRNVIFLKKTYPTSTLVAADLTIVLLRKARC